MLGNEIVLICGKRWLRAIFHQGIGLSSCFADKWVVCEWLLLALVEALYMQY